MKTFLPFFSEGPARDSAYEAVRDTPHFSKTRELIEIIWGVYWKYADKHFPQEVRNQFYQRTWEMYLGYVLIKHGYDLKKYSDEGPEFYIHDNDRKVWIEAIAPEPGTGPDAVPKLTMGGFVAFRVPEEQIIFRITHALKTKLEKYKIDLARGIIGSKDSYIVAINGRKASGWRFDGSVPFLIRATYGVGHLNIFIDRVSDTESKSYYQFRGSIDKKSGEPISTIPFLNMEFQGISAAIYSPDDILNVSNELGSEMFYVHNGKAKFPLPQGYFKFCREYWCEPENGRIPWKDWVKGKP